MCVVSRRLLWPVNVSVCVVYGLCLFVPMTSRLVSASIKAAGVFCRLASRRLPFYHYDSSLMPAPVLNHAFFSSHASKHRTPRSRLPLHKLPPFACQLRAGRGAGIAVKKLPPPNYAFPPRSDAPITQRTFVPVANCACAGCRSPQQWPRAILT